VPAAGRQDAKWCRLGYESVGGKDLRSLVTVTR